MTINMIRREIEQMKACALRLLDLAAGLPSVRRNAEVILTFLYILDFLTQTQEVVDGGGSQNKDSLP